jgi:phosphonate ABC transporter permease subunit PhnE
VVALVAGLVAASYGSRFGQEAVLSWSQARARALTAVLASAGMFILIFAIGYAINWLYQFDNPENWTIIPALIGGGVAALASLLLKPKRPYAIGWTTYTVMRGILNILRAIEPLIMAIVFVVWVGLGPFAGVMALTLHTIAALGKLFSEQVEGIDDGPVEAVLATGASRMQMVVYAVIPQIVPPFTAFALYRWDINVRMSTIIGFVGGGGIGLVLSQNIRQLRYRQVSVMLLAIAIVVATLDYASSKIRSRII